MRLPVERKIKLDFKNLFEQVVSEDLKNETKVALLFSGGVDSTSIGFALTDLGIQVSAYTFQMGEWVSRDMKHATKTAEIMNWDLTKIKVPVDNLEERFIELAKKWKCKKKTQFECTYPFLYVLPKIKENLVYSGIAADGHFGLSRKAMVHYKYPHKLFNQFRFDYFSAPNPAGQIQQKALIEEYGKRQSAPFLDKRIYDFFIQFTWDQLNLPKQKMPILKAYKGYFQKVGRRNHENLQLISGADKICESLLKTKLNKKNRSRTMDLYRDLVAEYG